MTTTTIKIIGFKVGQARPTFNRTRSLSKIDPDMADFLLGIDIREAFDKKGSDFLSIRRIQK